MDPSRATRQAPPCLPSFLPSVLMPFFLPSFFLLSALCIVCWVGCRYAKEDGDLESLEHDLNEETGWKLVHGDVFRPPAHRMLLAAAVGTGIQLVMLGLFVIMLTIMGTFYEVGRGVQEGFGTVLVSEAACATYAGMHTRGAAGQDCRGSF